MGAYSISKSLMGPYYMYKWCLVTFGETGKDDFSPSALYTVKKSHFYCIKSAEEKSDFPVSLNVIKN